MDSDIIRNRSSILKTYMEFLSNINYSIHESNFKTQFKEEDETLEDKTTFNLSERLNKSIIDLSVTFNENKNFKNLNTYIIICKSCGNFPHISFNENFTLNLLCNCKQEKGIGFDYFINEYLIKIKKRIISNFIVEKYCFCDIHNKLYSYHCETCSKTYDKICGMYVMIV